MIFRPGRFGVECPNSLTRAAIRFLFSFCFYFGFSSHSVFIYLFIGVAPSDDEAICEFYVDAMAIDFRQCGPIYGADNGVISVNYLSIRGD